MKMLDPLRHPSGGYFKLWILASVIFIAVAIRMIFRHKDFGWFLLPVWAFLLAFWVRQAFKQRVKS